MPASNVTPALHAASQSSQPGPYIELFQIDATAITGEVYCFTPAVGPAASGGTIRFNGLVYTPIDMESEGFELKANGAFPMPKIRLSNVNRVMANLVGQYNDLLGARITRIRTFAQFLDDGATPDVNSTFPPDVYKIERKSGLEGEQVEFELSAAVDQEGRLLPGRLILRDGCTRPYRRYTGAGTFDYSAATCRYCGEAMWRIDGTPTSNMAEDVCGKKTSDCKLRFGANAVLPFGGFPGVSRVRGTQ